MQRHELECTERVLGSTRLRPHAQAVSRKLPDPQSWKLAVSGGRDLRVAVGAHADQVAHVVAAAGTDFLAVMNFGGNT